MAAKSQAILNLQEFNDLLEEIKTALSERKFRIACEVVEMKHEIGTLIIQSRLYKRFSHTARTFIQKIADSCNVSEREIYYCAQFALKYPALDKCLEGLNIGKKTVYWSDIVKLLPEPKETRKEREIKCRHCLLHCDK